MTASTLNPRHGQVVWCECATAHLATTQAFTQTLLRWRFETVPLANGQSYTVIRTQTGTAIGGLVPTSPSTPLGWFPYVSVPRVEACAAVAHLHGGRVLIPPTDQPGQGRFAHIADPQGLRMVAYQRFAGDAPAPAIGLGVAGWHLFTSPDPPASIAFWNRVLGQDVTEYAAVQRGPARYIPHFAVPILDQALAQVRGGGGQVLCRPHQQRNLGSTCLATDPQGVVFGLLVR